MKTAGLDGLDIADCHWAKLGPDATIATQQLVNEIILVSMFVVLYQLKL